MPNFPFSFPVAKLSVFTILLPNCPGDNFSGTKLSCEKLDNFAPSASKYQWIKEVGMFVKCE